MVKLTLIRHGESIGAGTYIGRGSDYSLTEKGYSDIDKLIISKQDIIYTSSMKRAKESADIISAKQNIEPVTLKNLEEIDFGKWESLSYKEIEALEPVVLNNWLNDPINIKPPYGENLQELQKRVQEAIKPLLSKINDNRSWNITIVSHRGPIDIIILYFLGLDLNMFWNFKIDKSSVTILNLYKGFSELELLNGKQE